MFGQIENLTSSNPFIKSCNIKGLDIVLETSDFIRFAGAEVSFYPVFPSDLEYKTHLTLQLKLELINTIYYIHRCCENIKNELIMVILKM